MKTVFELEMQVRDYECDIQGIVNNAVYQNYLEYVRHTFLNEIGLDFVQWHNEGKDAVVIKSILEYKQSLKPGNKFIVRIGIVKKGLLKIDFLQNIYRKPDDKLCLKARVSSVIMQKNRPLRNDLFFDLLDASSILYETES